MKLGKIFICINILVLSLLWPRIIYRFDEYNRTIVLDGGHSYDIVETEDFSILLQNDKSFAIGEKYIEIRRRNLKIVIRKRKWFSRF